MANWTINSKTSKTSPADTDSFPIAESGNTVKRVTLANLYTYIFGKFPNGNFVPTLTNVTNVSSSTFQGGQYYRVGNVVTCSGRVDITLTTSGAAFELGMTLPVASAIANSTQVVGSAVTWTGLGSAAIRGDAANDRAVLVGANIASTSSVSYSFNFSYIVV